MSVTMDTYTVNANELQTMQTARLRTPRGSAAWITAWSSGTRTGRSVRVRWGVRGLHGEIALVV